MKYFFVKSVVKNIFEIATVYLLSGNNLFPCSLSCFRSFFSLVSLSLQPYATQLIGILPPQFIFSVYLPSFNELKHEYVHLLLRDVDGFEFGSAYTTVQKVVHDFEVSSYACVKSFKQHVLDPILLNMTTGYCHETFIKHCLCFKVFHLHHSVRKRLTVKLF